MVGKWCQISSYCFIKQFSSKFNTLIFPYFLKKIHFLILCYLKIIIAHIQWYYYYNSLTVLSHLKYFLEWFLCCLKLPILFILYLFSERDEVEYIDGTLMIYNIMHILKLSYDFNNIPTRVQHPLPKSNWSHNIYYGICYIMRLAYLKLSYII